MQLTAKVVSIASLPDTSGSVVDYPVTLRLKQHDDQLKPGMTASAEVVVSQVDGAVTVPSAALGPGEQAKMRQVVAGTERVYTLAKKYKLKTAFGTDVLFSKALAEGQGAMLTTLTRWYTPAEALAMATSTNGELMALSGPRNPYPGKLGVVEEGAFADLLLVDGNPLDNIKLVENPGKNFVVIMKDGKIYKNLLK